MARRGRRRDRPRSRRSSRCRLEPELNRPSSIIQNFKGHFGNIEWGAKDRLERLITVDILILERMRADSAYRNAQEDSDEQNARFEHDMALTRPMASILWHDTELYGDLADNESFRRWMTDTIFDLTSSLP